MFILVSFTFYTQFETVFFFLFFKFYFIFKLYNIVLVLPNIEMNPPQVYMCSPSWTSSRLPPHTIPLACPSAPAPSIQYHALNLDWWLISLIFNWRIIASQYCVGSCHKSNMNQPWIYARPLLLDHPSCLSPVPHLSPHPTSLPPSHTSPTVPHLSPCPTPLPMSHTSSPRPTPLRCQTAWGELPAFYSKLPLAVLHMVMCMFPCCSLNLSHPLLPPLCPRIPVLLGQGPQDNLDFLTSVQTWFPGKITSCDAECLW